MERSPEHELVHQQRKSVPSELEKVQKELRMVIQMHAATGIKTQESKNPKIVVELEQLAKRIIILNAKQKEILAKLRKNSDIGLKNDSANANTPSKLSIMPRRPNVVSRSPSILSPSKSKSPNRIITSIKHASSAQCPAQHRPRKSQLKPRSHSPPVKIGKLEPNSPPSPSIPPDTKSPSITPSKKARIFNCSKIKFSERKKTPPISPIENEEPCFTFSNGFLNAENNSEKQAELSYMWSLKLIPIAQAEELRKRRSERKRRSTANPQFSYNSNNNPSNDVPDKRRTSNYYLALTSRIKSLEDEKNCLENNIERNHNLLETLKSHCDRSKSRAKAVIDSNNISRIKLKELENNLQTILELSQIVPTNSKD